MASMDRVKPISLEAAADLSASQFRFVELSAGKVALVNGAGDAAIGVLMNKPSAAGQPAEVAPIDGSVVKVVAGAAVAVDVKVSSDASGRAITAVSTHHHLGFALEAAGAAGDIIRVLLISQNIVA